MRRDETRRDDYCYLLAYLPTYLPTLSMNYERIERTNGTHAYTMHDVDSFIFTFSSFLGLSGLGWLGLACFVLFLR